MGPVDDNGIMGGLDFGTIKKQFRAYIDTVYDHHLLMNEEDPLLFKMFQYWASVVHGDNAFTMSRAEKEETLQAFYPGLVTFKNDPTIENIASWISGWAQRTFNPLHIRVNVQETNTNGAEVGF
jgi:6-pyruvoyl-tetrahydropterin synthase